MIDKSNSVAVELGERGYRLTIGDGVLARTGELTRAALGERSRRLAIISNAKVHSIYAKVIEKSLKREGFITHTHLIGDGERAKSVRTAERGWAFLIAHGFERGDGIIALGGGVVGDLAGFVASTFFRGINYVQIPTTLLAQIDSSVGGKTAVNHSLGKNLIGTFHQPRAVLIDPNSLKTIPRRELRAGLYEAIKYGFIRDRELSCYIRENLDRINALEPVTMTHLITRCCQIKADVVAADERESGLRRILNFGHTVGHALEAATGFRRLKHGEAVGYGMQCASAIAEKVGIIEQADALTIKDRIAALGKLPRIDDLKTRSVIAAMSHDKKIVQSKLHFILPTTIGRVVVRDDIEPKIIHSAIEELLGSTR